MRTWMPKSCYAILHMPDVSFFKLLISVLNMSCTYSYLFSTNASSQTNMLLPQYWDTDELLMHGLGVVEYPHKFSIHSVVPSICSQEHMGQLVNRFVESLCFEDGLSCWWLDVTFTLTSYGHPSCWHFNCAFSSQAEINSESPEAHKILVC